MGRESQRKNRDIYTTVQLVLGGMFALLSAICFASFNVVIARMPRSSVEKGVLFSVFVTLGFSLALFLALEAGRISLVATRQTAAGIGYFAFSGICAMVFGRSLTYFSTRRLGAIRASAVKRLNPFFSVFLAAILLSENISRFDAVGLVAIAVAFAILIRESLRRDTASEFAPPVAYFVGAMAAFAYAIAYIGRKAGLELLDAPAFGTFVSALSGLFGFIIVALIAPTFRPMFAGLGRNIDKNVLTAAIFVSAGQILMFAALAYETVSTVVMVSSLEIFFSIFLAAYVLKDERPPRPKIFLATGLAFFGAILVAVF